MRIAIGSDHAGFSLKESLKESLAKSGHEVMDYGANSDDRSDYPDYGKLVASAVSDGQADRGVLVCGSGIGMCMVANRFPNARAAVLNDEYDAEQSRHHNDANIACFGARKLKTSVAHKLLDIFLKSPFEGGRHEERVKKLEDLR